MLHVTGWAPSKIQACTEMNTHFSHATATVATRDRVPICRRTRCGAAEAVARCGALTALTHASNA